MSRYSDISESFRDSRQARDKAKSELTISCHCVNPRNLWPGQECKWCKTENPLTDKTKHGGAEKEGKE